MKASIARDGFALITVLWIVTALAILAIGASALAREVSTTALNRVDMARTQWHAEGCIEVALAEIDAVLDDDNVNPDAGHAWAMLDRRLVLPNTSACELSTVAAGTTVDVNRATADQLVRLFTALGRARPQADSLADAVIDWRDPDGIARANGAEAQWYQARSRMTPRNAPIAHEREISRVRGLEADPEAARLLCVEEGRISIQHAPAAVLASLPGMSDELLNAIINARATGTGTVDLAGLTASLSSEGQSVLAPWQAELMRTVAVEPDAWILTARATAGSPPLTSALEVRVVRAGSRVAVTRRRTWVE